jgi:hypothetical protein
VRQRPPEHVRFVSWPVISQAQYARQPVSRVQNVPLVGTWQSYLVPLRHAIAAADFRIRSRRNTKDPPAIQAGAPQLGPGLGDEFRQNCRAKRELNEAGLLTDDEFAPGKAKLLG